MTSTSCRRLRCTRTDWSSSTPREPVARAGVVAEPTPVVDDGRLIGVVLDDKVEVPEPT